MNIFRTLAFRAIALSLALPLFALCAGCNVDSVDSTSAVVSDNAGTIYNYSGLYMSENNTNGSTNGYAALVVPPNRQSGVALTWLRLLQYGSVLEAYDNASLTWLGSISAQNGEIASFSLRGRTTAGLSTEIAGTLAYANQNSTMDAAWIEPTFSGSIFASATVSPIVTNSVLKISPSSFAFSTNDISHEFSASGGSGSFTWSVSSSTLGDVNPTTGSSTTYTSTHIAGTNNITVTDSLSRSATAIVTYK